MFACIRRLASCTFCLAFLIAVVGEKRSADGVQILYGFDTDQNHRIGDWLTVDGAQNATRFGSVVVSPSDPAFGTASAKFPTGASSLSALQIPGTAELGSSFTLAASIRETAGDFSRLFSSYNGGSPQPDEFVFDIDPSNSTSGPFGVRAIVNGSSVTRSVSFSATSHHHVAMTYDQGNIRLFLDGAQLGAAATVPNNPVRLANDLRFGEDYPPTSLTNELFEGFADDILVYDRALTSNEIASLYERGAAATLAATAPPPPPLPPPLDLASRIEMFVDKRLFGSSSGVELKLHPPTKHEVVLELNGQFESSISTYFTVTRDASDQVRLYYRGFVDGEEATLMAVSDDGVNFMRKPLGFVHNGSVANHIVWKGPQSHNMAPFLDTNPHATPDAKWKALGGTGQLYAMKSSDGIRWELMQDAPLGMPGAFDSQNTAFWDPEAQVYRSFSRYWENGVRAIQMSTSEDFVNWTTPVPFQYDVPLEHFYTNGIVQLPGAEQLFVGFPMRLDPSRTNLASPGQSGVSDAVFIASRDGVHWDRIFEEPWIDEGYDTTRSNMPAWGILETAPDEWSVYANERYRLDQNRLRRLSMRPYGFASASSGPEGGSFETPPLKFDGDDLVLNLTATDGGSMLVEVRDVDGLPIPGFQLSDLVPITGDSLTHRVNWTSGRSLGELSGKTVRLYFELQNVDLFAIQFATQDGLLGDYNNDGILNAADYTTWSDHLGSAVHLPNDMTPGAVTTSDYELWLTNFGHTASAVAESIPEPDSVNLTAIGLVMLRLRNDQRRERN